MIKILKEYVERGGNMVMLGRTLLAKEPDLHTWVLEQTPFIPNDATFNERVFCILNAITSRPYDEIRGDFCPFKNFFKGYKHLPKPVVKPQVIKPVAKRDTDKQILLELASRVGSSDSRHGSKMKKMMRMNQDANQALYGMDESQKGIQFIECPILKIRMLNLKKPYIEGILLMSVEDFDNKYPNFQKTCSAHKSAISNGLKVLDDNGLTKHEISVKASTITRAEIGEDGLSTNQRKGAKTRATHMANVDENGHNSFKQQALKRNTTILDNGKSVQQNALAKAAETIANKKTKSNRQASKLSKKRMDDLITWLNDSKLKYYFDDTEYVVYDPDNERAYYYDLVVPDLKICFEYQGRAYHPSIHEPELWESWMPTLGKKVSADEKSKYDSEKAKFLYTSRGIITWQIWENYEDISLCITFLEDLVREYKQSIRDTNT